jgi:hypothetical protein
MIRFACLGALLLSTNVASSGVRLPSKTTIGEWELSIPLGAATKSSPDTLIIRLGTSRQNSRAYISLLPFQAGVRLSIKQIDKGYLAQLPPGAKVLYNRIGLQNGIQHISISCLLRGARKVDTDSFLGKKSILEVLVVCSQDALCQAARGIIGSIGLRMQRRSP